MERGLFVAFTVGKSKIDSYLNVDFTPTKDVVQEGVSLFAFEILNFEFTFIWKRNFLIFSTIDKLVKGYDSLGNFLMTPTFLVLEYLNHNFLGIVCLTESIGIDNQWIPWNFTVKLFFAFWFVNRYILTGSFLSIESKELGRFTIWNVSTSFELNSSFPKICLLFLDSNFDATWVISLRIC